MTQTPPPSGLRVLGSGVPVLGGPNAAPPPGLELGPGPVATEGRARAQDRQA